MKLRNFTHMQMLIVVLGSLLAALSGCTESTPGDKQEGKGSITGTVVNGNGQPIAEVSISATGVDGIFNTGSDGKYAVNVDGAGNYELTFAKAGYKLATATLDGSRFDAQVKATADVTMEFAVIKITGTVTDANSVPLSGVKATVGSSISTVTAADGSYSIGSLNHENYTLVFIKDGYHTATKPVAKTLFVDGTAVVNASITAKTTEEIRDEEAEKAMELAKQNVTRAMELFDNAVECHFTGNMAMARYYTPSTSARSSEKGSIWMYTSVIEACNAIMHGLKTIKEHGDAALYDANFDRYVQTMAKLYNNIDYYKGTYELTSYTQTRTWSVFGVNRASTKGNAGVTGVLNVYDDQMWLIREFIEAYRLTGVAAYLTLAEYLTDYVLDGWDCNLNSEGKEYGGITWGPGYTTKHACSNGPMISPLVWLHELYKDKNDQVTYLYIDADKNRRSATLKKADYYLKFAKAIYEWQKSNLRRPNGANGVYKDMLGSVKAAVEYETLNSVRYRKHTDETSPSGENYSYNSGTMLSGAADLYRATGTQSYLTEGVNLAAASFSTFAKAGTIMTGYYTYGTEGFKPWFNGVLMRGYVDLHPYNDNSQAIGSFQKNLDYSYSHHLYNHFLPVNLLTGWTSTTGGDKLEGMFTFAYAAEYAILARYTLDTLQK